uniref:SV2 related protein b n=1 Tax=Oncorhynchus mykiss TaxID=8022 RepID=A0A8K9UY02_ONCMY
MMKSRTTCIMLIEVLPVLLAIWIMPTIGWPVLLHSRPAVSMVPKPNVCFSICMCKCLYSCLCVILWLPKSARFHVLSGNCYEIVKAHLYNCVCVFTTLAWVCAFSIFARQDDRGRIQDLLTPHYRRIAILLWFIWFANAFSYYGLALMTTELFQAGDACIITQAAKIEPKCNLELGHSVSVRPYLFIFYSVSAGVFVTLFVIDRIGRKKSMAMCILPLYSCIGRAALTVFIARAFITGGFQVVYPTATTGMGIRACNGMAKVAVLAHTGATQEEVCVLHLLPAGASVLLPIETTGLGLQETSQITAGQEKTSSGSGFTNTCQLWINL